jgi:hypothetical protein
VARAPGRGGRGWGGGGARRRARLRAAHGEETGPRRRHRGAAPRDGRSPGGGARVVPALVRRRPVARLRRRAAVRPRVAGRSPGPPAAGAPPGGRARSTRRRGVEPDRHDRGRVGAPAGGARGLPGGERPGPGRGALRRQPRRRQRASRALGGGGGGVRAGAAARAGGRLGAPARIRVPAARTQRGGARRLRARPRTRRQDPRNVPRNGAGAGRARPPRGGARLGGRRAGAPPGRGLADPAQERDRSPRSRSAAWRCSGSPGSVRDWTS